MKLFNNLVQQIKPVISDMFGILDKDGVLIACSDNSKVDEVRIDINEISGRNENVYIKNGFAYQKIFIKNKLEYIVFMKYSSEESLKFLSLISINIINLKTYYDEKFDRLSFIKNIIVDNIMPGDIFLKAKDMHISYDAYRVLYLIKTDKVKDAFVHEIIEGLFPNRTKDFVVVIDSENVVLVREIKSNSEVDEIMSTAKTIMDTINSEVMIKARIGISSVVDKLRDLARAYKEAQMAIVIGDIFEEEKTIVSYNNLGIGRLIYQIPKTLCRLFLQEVFKGTSLNAFESEIQVTIQKFFENNLNVSETSRQLYIHRNTLVYRLEKIQKATGLDLRKFDDAIIFKVATMVQKYLEKD